MTKLSVRDLDLKGKRVLMRVDFNVPLEKGVITDDTRIRAALPTIKYIIERGGKLILMSHLGRPKGVDPKLSLKPVSKRLSELLGKEVKMAPDCIGDEVQRMVAEMKEGDVILLENLRFHKGETENDPEFARELASLGDVYVSDAFGAAHRAHASTEGVTKFIPQAAAGFLMEKEIEYLSKAVQSPEHPFVVILGGAKVSDKIGVLTNMLERADAILIGGGMAYTFLKAQGYNVGKSIVEDDKLDLARQIMNEAKEKGVEFKLPVTTVIADRFAPDANSKVVKSTEIPDGWLGVDIGPETVEEFSKVIGRAKMIVWNGPLGVYEFDKFAKGTVAVAKLLAESDAITIIGGGDCVAAVQKAGVADKMTHISTGGGASLEFLEGKELPGIAALSDKG
ncbi:TPA: phosphoglycerate kinase [Candidatus Poribacteria bacterium]|nr:phosphoglycerate kinase [Candidatus Poribacteria bacterium]HEX29679.1 phosphoglycerate kinase [Candidatus Poribacteria bacterium]